MSKVTKRPNKVEAKLIEELKETGIPQSLLQTITDDRESLRWLVELAARKHLTQGRIKESGKTRPSLQDDARRILGDDLISPEEIEAAYGVTYAEEQIEKLRLSIPDRAVLESIHENGYVLVAGPPRTTTLRRIVELNLGLGLFERSWFPYWTYVKSLDFVDQEALSCRWLTLLKQPPEWSFSLSWERQAGYVKCWPGRNGLEIYCKSGERVPNVSWTAWIVTAYKRIRNVGLLDGIGVRTSTPNRCYNGMLQRVGLGNFNKKGLTVFQHDEDGSLKTVGLALYRDV